jgi:NADPH:quinone reductase-like Zn-dependent oxidoreductase
MIKGVDLVLDLVGGRSLEALWNTLAPNGRIVSSVAVDIAEKHLTANQEKGHFFK